MFDSVDPRQHFPSLERAMLAYWREEDTFKRSIQHRAAGGQSTGSSRQTPASFSFYDGPPFATGLPHYGHLLAGTIKDVIPRYQTMRGNRVERRFGWDCHGLPVEYEIEKEHSIQTKKQIEEMGVKAFNDLCRGAVQRFTKEWRSTVERMGRWVDMDWDYRTMDPDYMESIWWVFKQLHEKGLIYEGKKAMQICPRCVTPLANFEVTQGYKDVQDLAVTWKFELTDEPQTFVLAWTTTPWSTLSTMGLSIKPDATYVKVKVGDERVIMIKERLANVLKGTADYTVEEELQGTELVGKSYKHIAPWYAQLPEVAQNNNVYRIYGGDYVESTEGTGIVTINGSYGEIDMEAAKRNGLPIVMDVDMTGHFTSAAGPYEGMYVKDGQKKLLEDMKAKGLVWRADSFQHSYPHCWRCDTPLLNYATSSWFVRVEKVKESMRKVNAKTEWVPGHLRDGRFGKWLEGARDWAISRNRYWGTPLPIWRNEATGELDVLGGRDDLFQKMPERFTKVTVLRHGESDGNLTPIYQCTPPGTDLTAAGKRQAKRAAAFLEHGPAVTTIYASPLARTEQTAKIIAKETRARLVIDDRLREVSFGEYEGKHVDFSDLSFVKARRQHKFENNKVESIYHFPGMETWNEVQTRVDAFLRTVLPQHRGQHIVIVTHADPLLSVKHFFTKEEPNKLTHQPYPTYADPVTFYWDHETGAQLDLHKETVDGISWKGAKGKGAFTRIPDVLDCWFESGAMPYAQSHFPFEPEHKPNGLRSKLKAPKRKRSPLPPGFPADFIAEGIDQTRGWFYTLTVLAAALFKRPAFLHCVVNGTVLAEDGKKMSKRLKNYPEPLTVVEKYGADAVRFALMRSPAVRGEDLRFSEKTVEEALRGVLLPLWNAYVFFVTYANAARWTPVETRIHSSHPLDRWIRAEVQDLVNRMTAQLEQYDLSATCEELAESIDALTNWYVRLSRRRFAGKGDLHTRDDSGAEEDQRAALGTLHDVLLTLSQLLAPFCPFLTEALYLNLAGEPHGSVHLTDWPAERALTLEEQALLKRTRLLRTIVSLGLRVRAERKVKTRQPLARATIAILRSVSDEPLSGEELRLLREELNVKQVDVVEDAGTLAQAIVLVDARKVGPRLGARVQELIAAGKQGSFSQEPNGSIVILGEKLSADEAKVVYLGKEGQDAAVDRGVAVSLDTTVTEALALEGCGRDLIRAVQKERKDAGLAITDRIKLAVEGADDVLQSCGTQIAAETNAVLDTHAQGEPHVADLNGSAVTFRFEKL